MRTGRMKRGFTLIETVVTVGIVAAMAAVVIPQVAKQFDAADPTRIQNDLKNIQTAIETFNVNVRTLPGDLDDLANLIDASSATTGTDSALSSGTALVGFASSENTLWQGPYLDQSIVQASPDDSITTAFGARIQDNFVCYASGNDSHGVSKATASASVNNGAACAAGTGQKFLAIQVTGVACSTSANTTFMAINELFDGVNEGSADVSGRVRCLPSGDTDGPSPLTTAVVYFLAVPIT